MMITHARLYELLEYDPAIGRFRRKQSMRSDYIGQTAGGKISRGYRALWADGAFYLEHRLVWFYVHGKWPPHCLDHVNGNRADNRIGNLRLATHTENAINVGKRGANSSGFKGVSWHRGAQKWRATISVNRKQLHLGFYEHPEEAHEAYVAAARKHYGEFARAA